LQPSPRRSPRLVRCVVEDEADSDDDGGVAGMFSSAQQKTAVRLCGVITGARFNWRSALTVARLWGHYSTLERTLQHAHRCLHV
jgi:hypothetical protein